MADQSHIEWTDATWNPVVGCSITSPGCTNCYAMPMARRIEAMQPGSHYAGTTKVVNGKPVWTGKLALAPHHILTQPLRWRRPRRIFVNSMGDLFHEDVPDEWIDQVFRVMALTPHHTYQALTKRSARMRAYLSQLVCGDGYRPYVRRPGWAAADPRDRDAVLLLPDGQTWPLPNVWLGVSTEDQRRADERVPDLLATPAAVRFVSAEPLLGPLNLFSLNERCGERGTITDWHDALRGLRFGPTQETTAKLDLVIVGGESGPRARPMHPDWARSLRDQCRGAGVPFFFKQWGEWAPRRAAAVEDLFDARRTLIVRTDGSNTTGLMAYDETAWVMDRVGKRTAGRLLDGIEHNAMPEARA
ncbi:MAG: phage Gp37/Gp68 family protein [Pseudomonadota bacterium]